MYPSKQEYIAEVTVPEVERVYVPLPGEDNVWHWAEIVFYTDKKKCTAAFR